MNSRVTNRPVNCFILASFFLAAASLEAQNPSVLTWHNDQSRTGQNLEETTLTSANVNEAGFGKVSFAALDGKVDAQPLYVPNLSVAGQSHNVVFAVTENDTVYAFDAQSLTVLWKKSLLQTNESSSGDQGCSGITPQIGITATPVIDLTRGPHGAIYIVNMTLQSNGSYHQRINALDLTTGGQLFGGPTEIQATYPGVGANSAGGIVTFAPGQYVERAALLEWNGGIYTTWASHCDNPPYTGWVLGYSASTLQQTGVLNLTPNGKDGGIWMSGAGPAATPSQFFLLDGNGTFDTTLNEYDFPLDANLGNAFLNISVQNGALKVEDYYATDDTVQQSETDTDLGAGGVVVLPTEIDDSGNSHYLVVGAGKDTNIYVADRIDMGKYHPNGGYIYQVLSGALPGGSYAGPAYFNAHVFYGGVGDPIKAFQIKDAKLVSTAASQTPISFAYPGATPSISANGTSNAILWAVKNSSPNAVLYAYDANDLAIEFYDSDESGTRDQFGPGNKFITPTIANGRVFVGTGTGVAVFGLLAK